MREIKFRFWDKIDKEIVVELETLFLVSESGEVYQYHEKMLDRVPNLIPMQFTGLEDKNGKEIYEGDIVKSLFRGEDKEVIGEIIWVDGGFFIGYKEFKDDMYAWAFYKVMEVIGNIYENKELLEGEQKDG